MGRHSTGEKNNKIALSFIFTVLAVVLALGLVAWYVIFQNNKTEPDPAAQSCVQGEATLRVAALDEVASQQAHHLVQTYNQSQPKVRDFCVKAELSSDLTSAGVVLTSLSDSSTQSQLADHGRSAATLDWPVVGVDELGVAMLDASTTPQAQEVSYPVLDQDLAAALVAATLSNNDLQATTELLRGKAQGLSDLIDAQSPAIAVARSQTPAGYEFKHLDELLGEPVVQLPIRAVTLNATDQANEDQVRIGADFASASTTQDENPIASPAGVTAFEALAQAQTQADQPEATPPAATLFLLDTSAAMGQALGDSSWYQLSAREISARALALGQSGQLVGLWNYSSPMNPGVTQGWRDNVGLEADASVASNVVLQFGTGGQPLTHSALIAALGYVGQQSTPEHPVRLVLISSGSADDADIAPAVTAAAAQGVQLQVLFLGQDEASADPALVEATQQLSGQSHYVPAADQLPAAFDAALA